MVYTIICILKFVVQKLVRPIKNGVKVFNPTQNQQLAHVWEFLENEHIDVSQSGARTMLEVWLEVKDGQKWARVATGVLDISSIKSAQTTMELSDKEEPICEISLQFRHLRYLPRYNIFCKFTI